MPLPPLNFPQYDIRLRQDVNRVQIFDVIRRKWLVCTPEEWVRQHLLHWLLHDKGYLASNIALESSLKVNRLARRSDLLAYKNGLPFLLAECKAPDVKITQTVFDQIFRYNLEINAPLLAVTNGIQHYFAAYSTEEKQLTYLRELPDYTSI